MSSSLQNQIILIFRHGCSVFWQCSFETTSKFQEILSKCEINSFSDEESLQSEYRLILDESLNKPQIKNDCLYLPKHQIHQKILISYGLMQDLILCRTTYSLNSVIRHSRTLAEYMLENEEKNLDYSLVLKNIGRLYIMRDAFALSRGILDCPKYSFYKGHLSAYAMVRK